MIPAPFAQSNCTFGPPDGYDESQVRSIPAYHGKIDGGNMDGSQIVVVAWQPTAEELRQMIEGAPIFLTCVGGLTPHFLSVDFDQARMDSKPLNKNGG